MQALFEDIIQKMDQEDVYAHIALGNIYFSVASDSAKYSQGKDPKAVAEREGKYQQHALTIYRKAFELADRKCIFASNGIALVCRIDMIDRQNGPELPAT